MFRERLRSGLGCRRCRQKRKKCDEVHPVCGGCQRWTLSCIWLPVGSNASSSGLTTKSSNTASVLVPRAVTGHGVPPFRDQAQLVLLCKFSPVYQSLFGPLADRTFGDLSSIVQMSLHTVWMRDALNAFTGYMISGRTLDRKMDEMALSTYQSAVVDLRKKLSCPLWEEERVPALVCATFLGLYEVGAPNPRTQRRYRG